MRYAFLGGTLTIRIVFRESGLLLYGVPIPENYLVDPPESVHFLA